MPTRYPDPTQDPPDEEDHLEGETLADYISRKDAEEADLYGTDTDSFVGMDEIDPHLGIN